MEGIGKTLAIVNPAAHNGDGSRAAAFLRYASGDPASPFGSLDVVTTKYAGHAVELAASSEGYDCVLACGGDGVVHEIANGLMRVSRSLRPALALIPCGNGNDYARTLGMDFRMENSFSQLASAHPRSVDVGVCNGEHFVETLSFGLDAAIALGTHERRLTGKSGTRLFVEEGASQILFHRDSYDYEICGVGGQSKTGSMHLLAVQVGPTYGGGFRICPEADPSDGELDCCIAKAPLSLMRAAYLFARAKNGKHVGRSDVFDCFKAKALSLEFDREPPAQIDGEPIRGARFDISVVPAALDVYFPDSPARL